MIIYGIIPASHPSVFERYGRSRDRPPPRAAIARCRADSLRLGQYHKGSLAEHEVPHLPRTAVRGRNPGLAPFNPSFNPSPDCPIVTMNRILQLDAHTRIETVTVRRLLQKIYI